MLIKEVKKSVNVMNIVSTGLNIYQVNVEKSLTSLANSLNIPLWS